MARQINLLNPALRPRREWLTAGPVAAVAGALLALVTVAGVWLHGEAAARHRDAENLAAQAKQAQERLAAETQRIAGRKADPRLAAELARVRSLLASRQEVIAVLEKGDIGDTRGFSEFLRGFGRQTPTGLWLTGFTISAAGRDMEIRGRMASPQLLPDYVRRLNAEPAFRGLSFAALDLQRKTAERPAATAGAAPPSLPAPAYVEFVLSPTPSESRR